MEVGLLILVLSLEVMELSFLVTLIYNQEQCYMYMLVVQQQVVMEDLMEEEMQ